MKIINFRMKNKKNRKKIIQVLRKKHNKIEKLTEKIITINGLNCHIVALLL